jgi:hypothetical protein
MFATICWLFTDDDHEEDTNTLFDMNDGVKVTWMSLYCGAAFMAVISSCCFIIFVTLDKHHEIDIGTRSNDYGGVLMMFLDLYFVNALGWFFALVPMVVAQMTFKFIFYPIASQNQDECTEFAKYKSFYSALHKFVSKEKSDLKLQITNRFLLSK